MFTWLSEIVNKPNLTCITPLNVDECKLTIIELKNKYTVKNNGPTVWTSMVVFQNPGMFKGALQKVNPFKSSTQVSAHFTMRLQMDPQIILSWRGITQTLVTSQWGYVYKWRLNKIKTSEILSFFPILFIFLDVSQDFPPFSHHTIPISFEFFQQLYINIFIQLESTISNHKGN